MIAYRQKIFQLQLQLSIFENFQLQLQPNRVINFNFVHYNYNFSKPDLNFCIVSQLGATTILHFWKICGDVAIEF